MEAIEGCFGHAFVNPEFREEMKTNEVGQKVWGVLADISTFVTIVTGAPQIATATMALLTAA